jgi:lysophospholipase L1-like esterase
MQAAKIPTDDLCAHAQANLKEIQLPANVHFTPQGYRYLAEKIVGSILEQMPAK